jgi:hypothetical protein
VGVALFGVQGAALKSSWVRGVCGRLAFWSDCDAGFGRGVGHGGGELCYTSPGRRRQRVVCVACCCGTAGEDFPCRGRLLVFEVKRKAAAGGGAAAAAAKWAGNLIYERCGRGCCCPAIARPRGLSWSLTTAAAWHTRIAGAGPFL